MKLKTYIEQAEKLFEESMQGIKDYGNAKSNNDLTVETLIATATMCGLNTTDIDNLSVATLLNSINEYWKIRNGEETVRTATQSDIDAFFNS